jgi:hypothetical protein
MAYAVAVLHDTFAKRPSDLPYPDLDNDGRPAGYVERSLRARDQVTWPIDQPTKFELVVKSQNSQNARHTIPESILLRADEVIRGA